VTQPTQDNRALLLEQIAKLRTNHPIACTGCALEDAEKKLARLDDKRNADVATMMRAGCTDSTATHIVDALTRHGFSVTDLPNSGHGTAIDAIFHDLSDADRIALGNFLVGSDDLLWPTWLHSALISVEHDEDVASARDKLRELLAVARSAVADVRAAYQRLAGEELHDVDYAEGDGLLGTYLEDADRAIRTAAAVNPHR
jgi:hypothetical protein